MLDQITDLIREQACSFLLLATVGEMVKVLLTVDMLQYLPMHWSHALTISSDVHIYLISLDTVSYSKCIIS